MSTAKKQQGKTSVSVKLPPFSDEKAYLNRFINISDSTFEKSLKPNLIHLDYIDLRREDKVYKDNEGSNLTAQILYSQFSYETFVYIKDAQRLYRFMYNGYMKAAHLIALLRAEQDSLIVADASK